MAFTAHIHIVYVIFRKTGTLYLVTPLFLQLQISSADILDTKSGVCSHSDTHKRRHSRP
jgi:hypothetical protein